MSSHSYPSSSSQSEALRKLEQCRAFEGPPTEFWPMFVRAVSALSQAVRVRALVRLGEQWRLLAANPPEQGGASSLPEGTFREAAARAFAEGQSRAGAGGVGGGNTLFISLDTGEATRNCLLELTYPPDALGSVEVMAATGTLVADTPRLYLRQRQQRRLEHDVQRMSTALEVFSLVNAQRRFDPAAMALVNESAARFDAIRATLGWVTAPYVRVVAMSGTERFERKMQVMQLLESAMEETRDQEDEVFWPSLPESDLIVRDHEAYARDIHVDALLSVPLRVDGETCGVLLLGREHGRVSEEDALGLRVIADQTARALRDLRERDRWFGVRWARAARRSLGGLVGPRHTWIKVGAIVGTVALAICAFVPFDYRVEGTFIVRPESSAHLPVPFDGYLAAVSVRPGDDVSEGQTLLELDRGELRVEQAAAQAELRRYLAEADRAEADANLAELRVARAMAAQSQARLDLIQYRLGKADIRSPFDGVVIAGDLRDRLGAPLKQGEVLLQVARLDGLFVEVRLDERDIDLLGGQRSGAIAFASRPDVHFPITIERIEPGAVAEQTGNVFVIRAHLQDDADWLRPGMSGVAKLDAGQRTLLWRATHRLVDFLRMKLWF